MAISLYSFVDTFSRALDTIDHVLKKGEEFAAAEGVDPESMLDWRLVEDMNPLRFQLAIVVNFSRSWISLGAGVEAPAAIEDSLDLAGFHGAIAEAKAFLAGLTPEQFAGRDELEHTHTLGNELTLTMPIEQWLRVFALTNIHFHMSMVYGILRARGVQIGKVDLFSSGV
ncbi:MAG: DUF1993 domain-containing protein [Pseudomonadales bacterium]|jgi:hypothetical protein|nr:DUF1993 domain-containing protein [Pseudomonadales bacterium]